DHARRAGAGARGGAPREGRSRAAAAQGGRRGRRRDRAHAGKQGTRLVPRRAQHWPHGSRSAVERDPGRGLVTFLGRIKMTSENVSIVIVSHSPEVARGTADMVRQMVGDEVKVAHCGGNPDGGLGTDVQRILLAIEQAWSPRGVAILVDLGGAET